jgi:hypothetical protein
MVLPGRIHRWGSVTCEVIACLLLSAVVGQAEGFRFESVGVRGGFPGSRSARAFNQAEGFANWNLPWDWDLGKEWHLQSRLDLSIGWLGDHGNNALIATAGPSLVLGREPLPLSLEGGVSPAFISRHKFGSKDFGTEAQFTSYVGLNWDFAAHWRVSYRFQHMSNAGLGSKNPGLNMQFFGLSYVF